MAERRMFAKTIIDSDAFLEMPISSQCLYFHLSMRADDEGFINKPKTIMRMTGTKDDDINVLILRRFIIPFESGIVVIKHWKIHNYIRGDRLCETKYQDEKSALSMDGNDSYVLCQSSVSQVSDNCQSSVSQVSDNCQSSVSQVSVKCQHRLGKDRLGKDRLGKDSIKKEKEVKKTNYDLLIDAYTTNKELKDTIHNFIKMRKTIKAALTDYALKLMLKKLSKFTDDDATKIEILERSVMNSWKDIYKPKGENDGDGVYGTKQNIGKTKKYNIKPPATVELTDEDRRRAEEELL